MASASRELLAAAGEVWGFLAEPHHLADWWPGIVAVEPDRRRFAVGARWGVQRREPPLPLGVGRVSARGRFGRTRAETLVIGELVPGRRWSWELVGQRGGGLAAAVELEPTSAGRTRVTVTVATRSLWGGSDRPTARAALDRLYELVQTAAEL